MVRNMPSWIICVVAILCLNGFTQVAGSRGSNVWHRRSGTDHVAGSGAGSLDFSDDEDLMDSGSGSGSGMGDLNADGDKMKSTTVATTTGTMARTTDHPRTGCEAMRQSSRSLLGKYVPRCLPNGDYDSLQCHGYPGTSECWCSDLMGREIPGTLMEAPNYPRCDDGSNLPPCVHQLVKHSRSKLLGSFPPACAVDGQFDRVQCRGSVCFCVHESTGKLIPGSEVPVSQRPKCDEPLANLDTADVTTRKMVPVKDSTDGQIDIDGVDDQGRSTPKGVSSDVNIDKSGEKEKDQNKPQDDNKTGSGSSDAKIKSGQDGFPEDKVEKASEIMTQPGILAGIIGGSVVLLLCVVLLIMFVVYRMRKKDEGSYPLDEPRKTPNYNYVRAPEKEFYA